MADISTIHINGTDYNLKDVTARTLAGTQSNWAQTDSTAVDFIKNKPTVDALMSGTSTNAVQNKVIKAYVDSKVTSVMRFMGAKATEAAIKAITEAQKGDVWLNQADGSEWVATKDITAADPTAWEKLGFEIDLSEYAKHGDDVTVGGAAANSTTGISVSAHSVTDTGHTHAVSASGSFTPAGTNQASAVTFGDPDTDQFVKSYPGATSHLVKGTATKMSSYGSQAQWSASVTGEVLSFSFTPNGLASGADVDVATGALASTGTGGEVMTGLGTASKAAAVTAMPTATAAAQAFSGSAGTVSVSGSAANHATGISIANHTVTDNGHTHSVSATGTID